jgi:uncharacterized membrane protein YidH (DUF202 family)
MYQKGGTRVRKTKGKNTEHGVSASDYFRPRLVVVAHCAMASFFVHAAYLQRNDPDPLLWCPIYLVAALISGIAAFGSASLVRILSLLYGCLCLMGVALCIIASPMRQVHWTEWMAVEEAREMSGLLLIAVEMAFIIYTSPRTSRSSRMKHHASSSAFETILSAIVTLIGVSSLVAALLVPGLPSCS